MAPSINWLNNHRAEKSPIQNRTAPATRHRAAPTAQVSGAKTLTVSSDSNAEKDREKLILWPSGGASLDISRRNPAESFTPAKCRLHRFSGLYRFCLFFYATPIQTISNSHFSQQKGPFTFSICQIAGALHTSDLIRFQVIRFSIVFESPAIQNLSISAITLIGNGGLPPFVGQQNELLL